MPGTTNNLELMEAMKKLDADLVALFATAAAEPLEQLKKQQKLWSEPELQLPQTPADTELIITPEIFQRCNALQLHLEAVTLQPEGTHRMELLQSEVRPIFTVECQLSEDLIKSVARYPMFHVMQFESEKFQSLTQCTRFGQTQTREVQLAWKDNGDMGHVDLTIWWREPGTCLNEMLGMGRLHLRELYEALLLEQCKCVAVKRRDVHLGSIYVKISLRFDEQLAARSMANKNISNMVGQEPNQNLKQIPNLNQNQSESGNSSGSTNQAATAPVNYNSKEAPTPPQPPPPPPPPPQANNNRKASLASVNFMAETTKVRLLRGYIYAGELRQLSPTDTAACQELSLQPFWQPQPLVAKLNDVGSFQLQEQFAIINDEKFLLSVDRQQLVLELRPLGGLVRLPLHQFYIAYRDASITNHLCKGKLPVISIDGWTPIFHPQTQAQLGELKVLLAIGSESQIAQLKQQRGFDQDNNQLPTTSRTTDLLDMLQNALTAPPPPARATAVGPGPSIPRAAPSAASKFSFDLHIVGATGLPLNPGYGKSGKKQAKRQAAARQRFPPNESPNTYVTFQALNSNSPTYKSHEGLVYATSVVQKSTTPQWRAKFRVEVNSDYLSNPQKLFILKLWKKAALDASGIAEPTPLEDAIIGFAALNLSHKKPGGEPSFPRGWHNIVDFNGRVTGGLEAHVEPLQPPGGTSMDTVIDQFEQSMELTHLHLGQAIKRKYTELEQISQRLRTRLVDVTEEALTSPEYDVDAALDNWKMLETDGYDDELVADFERALRTPTPPNSPPPTVQSPSKETGRE
ncbi:C2 domain-containing protein 3 isoform X2 [Drosophila obscura]|uniref:C2 domain-containing protein 3 isoform X2 n=1 Tax=Drosophila obscura TaxID=7282 RepID=UPI001BB16B51|nr:C2 domain-containing protein 3 isoform X2 [Drosophila obscura]